MALKPKDTYRVQCASLLTEDMFSSFLLLYQPLIGGDAVLIYFTLLAESRTQKNMSSHNRLCLLMNHIPLDSFERARMRLEEYQLLHTYKKEGDTKDNYIYVLCSPLVSSAFMEVNSYMGLYHEKMGNSETESSVARFGANKLALAGYKDITAPVRNIKEYSMDYTVRYSQLKPEYHFTDEETNIHFDYDKFIGMTSTLVFPAELRTSENMAVIGRLATLYDLTPATMKIFVSHSIDLDTMTFDINKLKFRCQRAKPEGTQSKDPYAISPISFLQARQNGASVTLTDKKLLESLTEQMHFSNEVINVLVEYVLNNYDNKLSRGVVDKIAGQWARNHVKTKEDALRQINSNKPSKTSQKHIQLDAPDYSKAASAQQNVILSEEQKAKMLELQKKMGGKK